MSDKIDRDCTDVFAPADDGKFYLDNAMCHSAAMRLVGSIREVIRGYSYPPRIYGVPRGGIPVAYLIFGLLPSAQLVDHPHEADYIVDDIVDSGATRARYQRDYSATFLALSDFIWKTKPKGWVVFPWERSDRDASADDIVTRLLEYIGEDPSRGGLKETPQRVLKAWKEWTAGYAQDPKSVFKAFVDGSQNYDQMVVVKDLPFYSMCEHHLAPFFGTATIAYLPTKAVVGLSKLGRLLEIFARRLQVQERLTVQVADALMEHLSPRGVGVLVKARHLCMESRGLASQGHHTVTSALRGAFLRGAVKQEFLSIAHQ